MGPVPTKNMQTPPLSFALIFMKDASAESNEKAIFQFLRVLFFELWLIVLEIYQIFTDQKKKLFKSVQIYRKDMECSENHYFCFEFFCATFSF